MCLRAMDRYIIVQRRRLNASGKSPASCTSSSHSTHVESPACGPSTTLDPGMTYGSDSDSDSGGFSQNLTPGECQTFDDMNNIYDFPSSAHFTNEEVYVDMSLLPDIIGSCPGLFDPLSSPFTTGRTATKCSPLVCEIPEPSDHDMTQAPDLAPFSSLYSPSESSWLDLCPQMQADQSINPSPSDSSEYIMHPLPNANLQGEAHTYNLNLEGLHPLILSQIMDIVLTSQQQVKVKLSSAET